MNRKIGVILSYVLMIFEVLSTLLLTPFIIRTLGQSEYGVYKLVVAINAYLLLLDLGVGNSITRYIAKYKILGKKEKERQFMAVATIFYCAIAVLTIAIGMVLVIIFPTAFSKGLTNEEIVLGQKLLFISMLNSAVTLGTTAHNNVLIAYEKFSVSRIASIVQIIIRMTFTYIALKLGFGSIGVVTVNLIMTVLCRSFFVLYVRKSIKLKPLFRDIQFSFIKEIVVYSSLILLQMVATQINSTVDQVLIGALVPASSVVLAVYGVGTQIVQYYQSIGSAFTSVLMPGVVRLVEHKASAKELTDEMIRIGRIIFMVLCVILGVFLVCGQEFVVLWAGESNSQGYIVAMILMTAYLFILTESIGTQILWALNQHKEQAILKILIVLANIFLTVILIKWKPLIGATVGTFISLMLGDVVVMNIIFKKKLKMNLFYYYRKLLTGILPCLLLMVLVGLGLNAFMPDGLIWFCFKALVMVCVYAGSMLLFGMNKYEKSLCFSFVRKLKR